MENYIIITMINDFIFCPYSIYFHNVYQNSFDKETYQQTPQKVGQAAHHAIDSQKHSTKKNILQALSIYSQKYNLVGKIDTFNIETGELIEQKYSVTRIYDGFRFQIYAQYFALTEMNYQVKSLQIYSKKDNKHYPIPIPNEAEVAEFENIIHQINHFDFAAPFSQNPKKCQNCIYNPLCHIYSGE
ncbi:MAG: type V CRISPR-associated protein Cas4 [Lentisphaeria bacterium]